MTKILIHITRNILERSANCRSKDRAANCAFALATKELLPLAAVGVWAIYPVFFGGGPEKTRKNFPISDKMSLFILDFDEKTPEQRRNMLEESFELEIPDNVLEEIDISDVHKILEESETMELIEEIV